MSNAFINQQGSKGSYPKHNPNTDCSRNTGLFETEASRDAILVSSPTQYEQRINESHSITSMAPINIVTT